MTEKLRTIKRGFVAHFTLATLVALHTTAAFAGQTLTWSAPMNAQKVGNFLVTRTGARGHTALRVSHQAEPGHILWESAPGEAFLTIAYGKANIRERGIPQGTFDIKDKIVRRCDRQSVTSIARGEGGALVLAGTFSGPGQSVPYRLTLTPAGGNQLRFQVRLAGPQEGQYNRTYLSYASVKEEGFFGFGQQLTHFDQKGKTLPILVQEHGVGRGLPVLTPIVDRVADGGGGNPYITEAPAPYYITSRRRSLFLENEEYNIFNLSNPTRVQISVFSNAVTGRILYGKTPLNLIEEYTAYTGRMRPLPDWIHNGAIVSVQGGTRIARQKLETLVKAGVPLAGFWIQDWPGKRVTSVGSQLWWDWKLDETLYPEWNDLVSALAKQNARMLVYINPFLSNTPGHDELFNKALSSGYLVRRKEGTPYLIKNTNFFAGLIDLSNPDARQWIKGVIRERLIAQASASGWMADFGEALPFDALLYQGADPAVWHNRYPEEWALVNREAIEEAGRGNDIVFFNRSGYTKSPGKSTLFWLGDQLQTWDEYDGIKSAVAGLQSGGVSGFSLIHGDTGGYNAFSRTVGGKKIILARSPELLMRWMELSAFTAVFRTHEGLAPSLSAQFDTNAQTLAHLKRCAGIYAALAFYRKELVEEASRTGHPIVRHPFLHYPNDKNTYGLRYQFLYGSELMIAPVLDKGATHVRLYLLAGDWTNVWTGQTSRSKGDWFTISAPLGKPALFYQAGSAVGARFVKELKARDIN